MKENPYAKYAKQPIEPAAQENPYAKYAVQETPIPQPEPSMGKIEATARGALYGALQQPRDVLAAGYANLVGGVPFKEALQEANQLSLEGEQGAAQEQRPGYFTAGEIAGNVGASIIPAGMATKAIGSAAPVLAKAPIAGKALSNLAQGIAASKGLVGIPLAGAVQGAVSSGISEGDLSGALPGAIGAGVMGVAGKIAKPIAAEGISKARQAYVKTLQNAGISDLTPAQLTGSKNLELVDSVLGNMLPTARTAANKTEGQLRKFTKAALSKAGINADEITPEIRAAAEQNFSNRYNDMFRNTVVNIDDKVMDKVANITSKNLDKLPTTVKPIVKSYLKDITQARKTGLTGQSYQEARSYLTNQAKSMSATDAFTSGVLKDIRNTLDEAATRSIPAAQGGKLKELNRQYANYKTIQKAASNITDNSLEGILSPAALARTVEAANKGKGQKGYGELYKLSRAGRAILSDSIPNSGTAQRLAAQQLLTLGAGSGTYAYTQDPKLALGVAGATLAAPKLFQLLLNSPQAQTYFTKGIPLANKIATPNARRLGAILATQGANQ